MACQLFDPFFDGQQRDRDCFDAHQSRTVFQRQPARQIQSGVDRRAVEIVRDVNVGTYDVFGFGQGFVVRSVDVDQSAVGQFVDKRFQPRRGQGKRFVRGRRDADERDVQPQHFVHALAVFVFGQTRDQPQGSGVGVRKDALLHGQVQQSFMPRFTRVFDVLFQIAGIRAERQRHDVRQGVYGGFGRVRAFAQSREQNRDVRFGGGSRQRLGIGGKRGVRFCFDGQEDAARFLPQFGQGIDDGQRHRVGGRAFFDRSEIGQGSHEFPPDQVRLHVVAVTRRRRRFRSRNGGGRVRVRFSGCRGIGRAGVVVGGFESRQSVFQFVQHLLFFVFQFGAFLFQRIDFVDFLLRRRVPLFMQIAHLFRFGDGRIVRRLFGGRDGAAFAFPDFWRLRVQQGHARHSVRRRQIKRRRRGQNAQKIDVKSVSRPAAGQRRQNGDRHKGFFSAFVQSRFGKRRRFAAAVGHGHDAHLDW